jgi:NAD(P)-dependent dehydrogenase (short-subunit alcohol dehydrogenase family)
MTKAAGGKDPDTEAVDEPVDEHRRETLRLGLTGALGASVMAAGGRPAAAQSAESSIFSLSGKTALITGAARGIGRAIAVAFARSGADVAALDIANPDAYRDILGYPLGSQEELDETVGLVEAEGRRAIGLRADVADKRAVQDAVAHTLGRLGRLDIVVANAGVGGGGRLQDVSTSHFKTVLDINLTGAANTIQAAIPHMIERNSGRIIAVTSIAGRMGSAGQSDYAASKWGLVGLVKSAAVDLGPHNITVNAIAPTAVRTGIFGELLDNPEFAAGLETVLRHGHTLPVGMLEPDDMTGAAVFLASPAAQYISGAVLDVAAGYNAHYTG